MGRQRAVDQRAVALVAAAAYEASKTTAYVAQSKVLLLQDDLAVMAATLKPYTGGDGFRPEHE